MNRFFQHLRTRGYYKGVLGGNRRWLAVWGVIITWRVLGRIFGSKPVRERYELEPGQALLITDLGAPQQPS